MAQSPKEGISREVASRLRSSGLDKEALKELADVAADVHRAAGLRDSRVFPLGIIVPDGIGIKGNIGVDKIDLLKDILKNHNRVGGVHVFPMGIPVPDVLRVTFEIR